MRESFRDGSNANSKYCNIRRRRRLERLEPKRGNSIKKRFGTSMLQQSATLEETQTESFVTKTTCGYCVGLFPTRTP
eukprot:4498627-Amphidinium_carterae.1